MADQTRATRKRYDRLAPLYDAVERIVERAAFSAWRQQLWPHVEGEKVLEDRI